MQRLSMPRRFGKPLTTEQRAARHYAQYGTTTLPPRGTGLQTNPKLGVTAEQWAAFWLMGDVNLDGYIDDKDLELLEYAFGSTPGAVNWIGACDINGDGTVDVRDLTTTSMNLGKNIWDQFGLPKPFPEWVLPVIGGIFIGALFAFFGSL